MSERHANRPSQRAFFGRRKGHALKPRQAALFDTLLPRLALDLATAGARRPAHAVCRRRRRAAGNRLRRRRTSDRAGQGQSAHRLHRQRCLRQRHRQGARRHRRRRARQCPPAFRRRQRTDRLAAGGLRSRASTCFIPIRGRSGGTGSGASSRTTASRGSRASSKPGGELRFATDIADYAVHALARVLRSIGFRLDGGARLRLAQALARFPPARAMRPKPSAKAACRPISFSERKRLDLHVEISNVASR